MTELTRIDDYQALHSALSIVYLTEFLQQHDQETVKLIFQVSNLRLREV